MDLSVCCLKRSFTSASPFNFSVRHCASLLVTRRVSCFSRLTSFSFSGYISSSCIIAFFRVLFCVLHAGSHVVACELYSVCFEQRDSIINYEILYHVAIFLNLPSEWHEPVAVAALHLATELPLTLILSVHLVSPVICPLVTRENLGAKGAELGSTTPSNMSMRGLPIDCEGGAPNAQLESANSVKTRKQYDFYDEAQCSEI